MPRRLTANCKRARAAALVPYTVTRKQVVTQPFENLR